MLRMTASVVDGAPAAAAHGDAQVSMPGTPPG
jgi:hypothetical protein